MPAEEMRELIEADLNATEKERIQMLLLEKLAELDELENELRSLEAERGLPASQQEMELPKRMAALGMNQAAIDKIRKHLDALQALNVAGGVDRLRADVRQELAAYADVELTVAELLATIVDKRRGA